jgi:thymidylate kinase
MLVEFIGSTGSGKTTLIRAVRERLAKSARVTTVSELAARRLGMQSVTNPTAQNLIQELVGFPYFLRFFPRYRAFLGYTARMLSRDSNRLSITAVNNLRSLERKIGAYEICIRYPPDWIIFFDEGPVLAMHMFAYQTMPLADDEVARFASLIPLPDLLIYVKAPVSTLIKRTLQRADPPRELRIKDMVQAERAVRSSVTLFDRLIRYENIRSRLLIVQNSNLNTQAAAVECISDFINHRQAAIV